MIVSCVLPYFAPYPGYFLKLFLSDIVVILDTVQLPQGRSWVTRNLIKNDQGKLWLSVPVFRKGMGLQSIKNVSIMKDSLWIKKTILTLKTAYKNAPYIDSHLDFFISMFSNLPDKILELNVKLIIYLMGQLQINTKLVFLSELEIEEKGEEFLIVLLKRFQSKDYLVMNHGKRYLNLEMFYRSGINVHVLRYDPIVYPQLWGEFIPNLSTIDLLFNCGPASSRILSQRVKLSLIKAC